MPGPASIHRSAWCCGSLPPAAPGAGCERSPRSRWCHQLRLHKRESLKRVRACSDKAWSGKSAIQVRLYHKATSGCQAQSVQQPALLADDGSHTAQEGQHSTESKLTGKQAWSALSRSLAKAMTDPGWSEAAEVCVASVVTLCVPLAICCSPCSTCRCLAKQASQYTSCCGCFRRQVWSELLWNAQLQKGAAGDHCGVLSTVNDQVQFLPLSKLSCKNAEPCQ